MKHIDFEIKLMGKLLYGDDGVLEGLREQYQNSTVESREFTGVGFYTSLKIKDGTSPVANGKSFYIGDVDAFINEESALGFVLYVKSGFLSLLEGYTNELDVWPNTYDNITLVYDSGDTRNIEIIKKKWLG